MQHSVRRSDQALDRVLVSDGMLVEFASVVDAVIAATEIQRAVAEHNASLPENKRIEFRVGINLGDVDVAVDVPGYEALLPVFELAPHNGVHCNNS